MYGVCECSICRVGCFVLGLFWEFNWDLVWIIGDVF